MTIDTHVSLSGSMRIQINELRRFLKKSCTEETSEDERSPAFLK